jgi:hypothetical protein
VADSSSPALFWQPKRSRFPRWGGPAIATAAALLVGVALSLWPDGDSPTADPSRPVTAPSASAASPAKAAAAKPSSPSATSPSASPAPGRIDVDVCVASMFPADTFAREKPPLDFVCSQRDPRKGAIEMEGRLVFARGKGDVTDGMKEWSILGWYEMAAFAFARQHCCAGASRPTSMLKDICELDTSLQRLAIVANKGDPKAWEPQLDAYQKAIRCVLEQKLGRFFEWKQPVQGPERATFVKMVQRARVSQP